MAITNTGSNTLSAALKDILPVKDGVIEPDQIEDFGALDSEVQQMVADGDIDMDDAADLQ